MHRRTAAVLLATAGAVALFGSPAQAHNELTTSDPPAGAQLRTAPQAITLTFDEPTKPDFVRVAVTGAAGKRVAVPKPVISGNVVRQPFDGLPSGKYTVAYRVVSADGHPVNGSVTFTVLAPDSATGGAGAPTKEITPNSPAPLPTVKIQPAALTPSSPTRDRTRVFMLVTVALLCLGGVAAAGLHLVSAAYRRPKRRESA